MVAHGFFTVSLFRKFLKAGPQFFKHGDIFGDGLCLAESGKYGV